jgi:DNA-binding transcriptional LysR family regulator
MTQDQLETLEAIVDSGSFKAAATRLHKTQPALSMAIKKLENEFSLSIFDRSQYRPSLTPEGRAFFEQAREALSSFRRLEKFGRELGLKKQEPRLTVVVDPVAPFGELEALFRNCLRTDAVTELIILTEVMGAGVERLLNGEADFAIAPLFTEDKRIDVLPVGSVRLMPVAARSLLKGKTADSDWLKDHTQIVVVQTELGGRMLKRELSGAIPGGKRCFVTDHALKKKLILEGFGWGRLSESEIESDLRKGGLQRIRHREAKNIVLDFHIMRSNLHPLGPMGQKLWRAFERRRAGS